MITLCTIFSPFVAVTQQLVNIAWIPLGFLGSPTPSVGGLLGPLLGCTF